MENIQPPDIVKVPVMFQSYINFTNKSMQNRKVFDKLVQ
jgi:hypothetical protein